MKKGNFLNIINWLLVFSIPLILTTVDVKMDTVKSSIQPKNIKTNLIYKVVEAKKEIVTDIDIEKEEEKEEPIVETKKVSIPAKNVQVKEEIVSEPKEEIKSPVENTFNDNKPVDKKPIETENNKSDVLEMFSGNLSYYKATCRGCSGITATGYDVRDGKIYYNDPTYGNVRIIAAGPEIRKHSIVRIKNSSLGSNVLAIVLDRGGNIGSGRKFIVDVLTNDNESRGGVDSNVVIEVLRKGR